MDNIGLVELIDKLKNELLTPPADSTPMFAIGAIEVEISFTATRTGDGRIDLKIITAGMDIGHEHVQRIKVMLEPLEAAKIKLHRGEEEE